MQARLPTMKTRLPALSVDFLPIYYILLMVLHAQVFPFPHFLISHFLISPFPHFSLPHFPFLLLGQPNFCGSNVIALGHFPYLLLSAVAHNHHALLYKLSTSVAPLDEHHETHWNNTGQSGSYPLWYAASYTIKCIHNCMQVFLPPQYMWTQPLQLVGTCCLSLFGLIFCTLWFILTRF